MVLSRIEKIGAFCCLAQVEAGLIRRQSRVVFSLTYIQQIQKVPVRQSHFDDQIAGLTPNLFDGDQVWMSDVAKRADRANLLGSGQTFTAGKEFESYGSAVLLHGFPDVPIASPSQQAFQLISGADLFADL